MNANASVFMSTGCLVTHFDASGKTVFEILVNTKQELKFKIAAPESFLESFGDDKFQLEWINSRRFYARVFWERLNPEERQRMMFEQIHDELPEFLVGRYCLSENVIQCDGDNPRNEYFSREQSKAAKPVPEPLPKPTSVFGKMCALFRLK